MKIKSIHLMRIQAEITSEIALPVPSYITSGIYILRLETEEGLVGIGEPSPYGASPDQMEMALYSSRFRAVLGKDPLSDDVLMPQLAGGGGYGLLAEQAVLAGYSQAIWDLRGKIQQEPLYRLLNPHACSGIAAYASAGMWWEDSCGEEVLLEEALRYQSEGFAGYKLRPPTPRQASNHFARNQAPPPVDVERLLRVLTLIRDAVGDDWPLMVDAGCRLSFEEAARLGAFMQESRFLFFEEPLPREPKLYEQLKRRVRVPLAGGEALVAACDIEPWLQRGLLDVLQPDVNLCGIEELQRIDARVFQQGQTMVLHNWANEISSAANVAVAVGSRSCRLVEANRTWNPFRERVFIGGPQIQKGRLVLSDRPGLGVEVDETWLDRFLVSHTFI